VSSVYVRFALGNAAFLAWTLAAVYQPSIRLLAGVSPDILRIHLPFALVLAAVGTALVARALPVERRTEFLVRHFAMYLVVPFMLIAPAPSPDPLTLLGAAYLLAAGAWTVHAIEGLWQVVTNLADRAAALHIAAVVLVPFLALLPYEAAVAPLASDEPVYLVMTQSLVVDRDLDLRDQYDSGAYHAFHAPVLEDRHIIQVGEAQYPIRDLGLPLLSAVPFAIAGRVGVLVLMCIVGAALAAQLYLACRDLGIAQRPSLLAVAGASLTHPILTYTTQIYPELLAALAFVTAARLLHRGRATSLASLAGASACVGVLPWLSTRAWLIAVGVGLVIAYCALRPALRATPADFVRRVLAAAGPFAALVLVLSYANWRMFQHFMPGAGYYLISDQQQVVVFAPHIGALGLLFDRVFGLLPHTPLYLVAALGLVPLLRRVRSAELAALALGWLAYFVFIADIAYWWADGSPPSRYLLAAVPFLVVLLAAGIERLVTLGVARAVVLAASWGLAAYSLFIAFVYAVLPHLRYELANDIRATSSVGGLFEFLGRIVRPDLALLFPSLVEARATDLLLGSVWLLLVIALMLVGRDRAHTGEQQSTPRTSLP
jgi:hypothetical protein